MPKQIQRDVIIKKGKSQPKFNLLAKKKIKKNQLMNEFSYENNFDSLTMSNNHSKCSNKPDLPGIIQ